METKEHVRFPRVYMYVKLKHKKKKNTANDPDNFCNADKTVQERAGTTLLLVTRVACDHRTQAVRDRNGVIKRQ